HVTGVQTCALPIWWADRPPVVAEVPLDLSGDRRHGERDEVLAAVGIVSAGRIHQPQVGDLDEVVIVDATVGVPAGDRFGETHVEQHGLVDEAIMFWLLCLGRSAEEASCRAPAVVAGSCPGRCGRRGKNLSGHGQHLSRTERRGDCLTTSPTTARYRSVINRVSAFHFLLPCLAEKSA